VSILLSWGSPGNGNGQFNHPRGIAIDSSDNVYVSDVMPGTPSYRVQKFTDTGAFIQSWGTLAVVTKPFQFNGFGIGIDSSDNIYVADSYSNRVQKFTQTGTLIRVWVIWQKQRSI
jgi:tripartite motif-containing protein 71